MPLVYLPDVESLFLWGSEPAPRAVPTLGQAGEPWSATLVSADGVRDTTGVKLPLLETMATLAIVPAADVESLPPSVATWVLASKLAMELVARERVVPTISRRGGRIEARWAAALAGSEDAAKVAAIAASMPPAAHAVPAAGDRSGAVWAPDALVRAYLDAVVDALVRTAAGGPSPGGSPGPGRAPRPRAARAAHADPWATRWRSALGGDQRSFETDGFAERSVVDELARWSEPALGARDRLRACFRLELPADDGAPFVLRFLLQSPDDPSLLVPAADVWKTQGRSLEKLGRAFRDPQESLIEALGRAARLFPALAGSLEEARPEAVELDPAAAWRFLGDGAAALAEAGFGVIVPGELTAAGQRRLRLRMRVGGPSTKVAGVVTGAAGLSLGDLLAVDWEAIIGDEPLTPIELAALAKHKAPLVQFRGAWVAIDPRDLGDIQYRLAAGSSKLTAREALQAVLAGEVRQDGLAIAVTASGVVAELVERLRTGGAKELAAPRSLLATLRPYQERGLNWLVTMGALGLGACLADDMGLGKTMQFLAFLLRRQEEAPRDARPALLVAPTSVVGNWEREAARFAPSLDVIRHYGAARARSATDLPNRPGTLVVTTYGLLRRDAELLAGVDWAVAALDEAQNIKNASSATARAARALRAPHRFALTGTPVENRLAELWSILEFANPGLLGPLEAFRRDFALPIERYGDDAAAARLRRIVGPFILRRTKSDPTIIADLPPKHEMKVVCTLTREQATLYQAVVNEELRRIESADGIERRGRVLALLTFTKQICNHPAQYLGETGPLPRRSGKLARTTEMLEEAVAAGDKALVFTQFREMGDKLVDHLRANLGCEVVFLHGGTPKKARDEMVRRFQDEPRGPRIFVLSIKAGGTGLNLTAANHVFHFDRWWNPAVEDQATDRAYRIGQRRAVQVHKLVCAGTVEEKIDRLLDQKRDLAAKVVGAGEQWITELDGGELRALFALSEGAVADGEEDDDERVSPPVRPRAKPRSARVRGEVRP
ncbi:MAG: DEAD/DEAH box helicase [Kofleriaceae bacterium]|nr:DEAD/DEAH box helicase [Kofleriaceae bacterium]MBP9169910.1 DEAD/DEAH box helicase [Kofleriaceae bacterium]MBP9858386.1 DEAD/DEAH box helicase [Kofleriaceae bacterium]